MARVYRFQFEGTANQMLTSIRSDCVKNKIGFDGDDKGGEVKGFGFKASYTIAEDLFTVTVHRIPIFISWGTLDKEIASRSPSYRVKRID